jgi:colanic acid/amylovoran biosynthesis glycosyltransferase
MRKYKKIPIRDCNFDLAIQFELMDQSLWLFTDRFPYGKGESFLEAELKYLSKRFNDIHIIPFESHNFNTAISLPENVNVIKPPFKRAKNKSELIIKGLYNASPLYPYIREFWQKRVFCSYYKLKNWLTHFLVTRAELAFLKKNDLIEIFAGSNICYFYWGLRWSQVLPFINSIQAKIAVRFHGSDIYEHLNHHYIPFRSSQLQRVHMAVFVSGFGKEYLTKQYPQILNISVISRLGTVDYGLNPYRTNHIITLVSCSNLVGVKRVTLIAQCLKYLDLKIKWIHIGDGPEMNKIRMLAETLPDNIEVNLDGSINHQDLMKFYQSTPINAFINVSSSEGVPVSIMEALSFGIPVLATDVGGVSEIADNETGILVPSDISPELLSIELKKLIERTDHKDIRVKARKRWEERCNAAKIYPEFVRILKEI